MSHCNCGNPKCPNAYHGCSHCMCLMSPDFGVNTTICYSGPIHKVCCKCGYRLLVSGHEQVPYTDAVANTFSSHMGKITIS